MYKQFFYRDVQEEMIARSNDHAIDNASKATSVRDQANQAL